MKCISQATVDKTWQSIAEMDPADAGQAMFTLSENQPHLLGFVMELADDMDTDASELATYMLYVVYQMFVNASGARIPQVSEDQIEAQYKSTCEFLDGIQEQADDPLFEEQSEKHIENQPHVYRYVADALYEESDDPEEQMNISEEEAGEIFMMMKCVIDVVDSVTNQ